VKLYIQDRIRVSLNIVTALAQPLVSGLVFFEGFRTAPVPNSQNLPTPIQPATYAFSIWPVIFLGCIAYALYQALPWNIRSAVFRAIGWYTSAVMGLCCTWLIFARFGPVYMTLPIIVLMLTALLFSLAQVKLVHRSALRWLVAAPLGLYAGWLSVATFANFQEVLTGYNVYSTAEAPVQWAIGMIFSAACVAAAGNRMTHLNPSYIGGCAWALVAIGVVNLRQSSTLPVVVAAAAALVGLLLQAFALWHADRTRRSAGSVH